MQQTIQHIEAGKIIAILRGRFGEREEDIVAAMRAGGLTAVEVTLNSPNALSIIRRLADRFGQTMAVGAGTVLTPEEVRQAADAGASFIVSPNRDLRVIETTKQLNLTSLPGCFTPSEVIEAISAGADAAKLFPANSLGPAFLKALRGPLPQVRTVPTGGVTADLAREYFAAGAWAIGAGSELLGKNFDDLDALQTRTAAFVAAGKTE
ncbi:MAG TPA: bifunctional 4-hydroxy-2-oxoglutarate aldolase/2-dehydro-3-deoxy-phosphogluconate aldolase [Blastocatellia bacterium]|nr:bifunctional 4-hydroxy-2-oxoglutarate aldolase/2-dehydro-3-deoxy-phosphogluconate aldolase [Blastocatellia bacterium]HMV84573.1 bifunctional 4-hydroxy-2-oxoglutarate aldolase/2-dehydro-3-deoxy-phosphogluconate aldolase [Blastocatellia bacterium]HMX26456.1 bifunctional 4-hydroxy-2-oxoglutarate aldolase/2-dehydro-3-deoxy-phosphogluconate aldolase [Blastocatellia bacterium]HMY74897.1 bifunctional 4-hydroxy-2-oxoglutarate aldolase/2-dehydro-3-deoxy-phosphogluconate aldolase [Blastocatellia bacter